MDYSSIFVDLYSNVLQREKSQFGVNDRRIREAIQVMKEVYMPNPTWNVDETVHSADYNDPAHRIAYVHKHALCYTGLVCTVLRLAIESSDRVNDHFEGKRSLSLCSLGGGPGTDIVGVLAAFLANFSCIPCDVTIVDYFKQWKSTFSLILQELRSEPSCRIFSGMVDARRFKCDYLDANLLSGISNMWNVRRAVQTADLVTMVKFVSAAASQHTRTMIQQFFVHMKPGAMLLFVDNAGGGFHRTLEEAASQLGMVSVFGPLKHFEYEEELFSITRFGYTSQSRTKVCAQVWQKPLRGLNTTRQLRNEFFHPPARPRAQDSVRIDQRHRGGQRARPQSAGYYSNEQNDQGCCSII